MEVWPGGLDTVASALAWGAATHGDSPWLLFEPEPGRVETTTWADALERAQAVAALLGASGVGRGDRFHVHLTNRPEFYDVWFGAALAGAVIVPTNPLLTADELAYVIGHAGCALSVTQPELAPTVRAAQAAARSGSGVGAGVGVGPVIVTGPELEAELRTMTSGAGELAPPAPTDVLSVLYTSGTTSKPKGVLVTHAAYLHAGHVVSEHTRLRPDDRNLVVLPLFHGNAQYYSTMSALVTGASVALAPRFSASRFSEQAGAMDASVASLFAAPIRMILAAPESEADRRHRLRLTLFAQNVTDAELHRFESRFGCPLAQLYGMTETVAPPTINPVYGERRNLSIGRPITSAALRVEAGELLVGGEPGRTLMAGYLNDPAATAATLIDGWLHTGDQVSVDDDGYLYFVDRSKDLIKRAGENISSAEVEAVLNTHPAVFESAVIALPDAMYDSSVVAVVVLRPDSTPAADELIRWCAERMAKFKVPSRVEFVDDLPRTPVGQVKKAILRAELG